MARTAYDLSHVKSVSAWAILYNCKHAGKVVANWGDSGTVTTTVSLWDGPLKDKLTIHTAKAGGCGYDKLTACLDDIFGRDLTERGTRSIETWLEEIHDYQVIKVI